MSKPMSEFTELIARARAARVRREIETPIENRLSGDVTEAADTENTPRSKEVCDAQQS